MEGLFYSALNVAAIVVSSITAILILRAVFGPNARRGRAQENRKTSAANHTCEDAASPLCMAVRTGQLTGWNGTDCGAGNEIAQSNEMPYFGHWQGGERQTAAPSVPVEVTGINVEEVPLRWDEVVQSYNGR
jgi:hypothetical protein